MELCHKYRAGTLEFIEMLNEAICWEIYSRDILTLVSKNRSGYSCFYAEKYSPVPRNLKPLVTAINYTLQLDLKPWEKELFTAELLRTGVAKLHGQDLNCQPYAETFSSLPESFHSNYRLRSTQRVSKCQMKYLKLLIATKKSVLPCSESLCRALIFWDHMTSWVPIEILCLMFARGPSFQKLI